MDYIIDFDIIKLQTDEIILNNNEEKDYIINTYLPNFIKEIIFGKFIKLRI